MRKLRFESGADAIARNAKEAENRNCDMVDSCLWWGYNKDETSFFLLIPDNDVYGLSAEELTRLE